MALDESSMVARTIVVRLYYGHLFSNSFNALILTLRQIDDSDIR